MKTDINTRRPATLASVVGRHRPALLLAGGVGLAAACSRTSDPVEHYLASAAPTASAGRGAVASGGSAGATGGKSPSSEAGRSATAAGGAAPDAVDAAGQAGIGTDPVLMPPVDDCGDAPVSTDPFTRRNLRLAAAACANWHYCRFENGARALADELAEHVSGPTTDSLDKVKAAYGSAFELLSTNESLQFGPLSAQSESAGKDSYQGKGLRELMYSWPLSARCRVEDQVAQRAYTQDMKSVLVAGRGMFALDYLLFYPGSDTACLASSSTGQKWLALSADDIVGGKLEYASAVADDILLQAQTLRAAWASDGGNFGPLFIDATGYPSEQEAMKVLAWALLYLEREVKDWKLGVPSGHTATAPVSVAEAAFSGLKIGPIRQNLRGFRALFQGCGSDGEGLGFDDWLREAGHPELATEIIAAYRDAQAIADGSPELDTLTPEQLEALYQAVKALTDLLKNDLFGAGSPLGLTLPPGLEGDTD